MKLCLILSSLLLVPLALAAAPPEKRFVASKVIFMDGHFLSSSINNSYLSYTYSNPALIFKFDFDQSIILQNSTANFRKEGLSFVVENVKTEDYRKPKNFNSIAESSVELRPLISHVQGAIRIRTLTAVERNGIETFKKVPEGASKTFQISYDKGSMTTRSVGLDKFTVNPIRGSRFLMYVNFMANKTFGSVTIKNYPGKQFVIERTAKDVNCKNSNVEGLQIPYCTGRIQVIKKE